nr:MAG TPA: hypothetical protein [Caudoviricetes sp.]
MIVYNSLTIFIITSRCTMKKYLIIIEIKW